jgi:spermidine synthase
MMVLEIIATRILEPFLGSSLFTWIGVISVMMASLALGYFLGGRMADRKPESSYVALIYILSGLSIAAIPLMSYPILNVAQYFGIMYGPIFASIFLFSIPSILLAMISPYLIKLSARQLKLIGEISGNIYAISTVGSIFGTLLTGFYLIPAMGIKAILFSLSMILIANSVLFLGKKGAFPLVIGLVANLIIPAPLNFTPSPNQTLLYENYSQYQYMRVVDLPKDNSRVIMLAYISQSGIYLNSTELLFGYTKYQKLVYALKPDIKKALFIGLGGGSLPQDLHRVTNADITAVELDPEMVNVAKRFFNFSEDERMRVEVGDGRIFLNKSNEKYDYIAVDVFLCIIPPFHLTTAEFAEELKSHLNQGGIIFINIVSPVEGPRAALFRSILKVYRNSFKNVYIFPTSNQSYEQRQNIVMLATDVDYGNKQEFISLVNQRSSDKTTRELVTTYYDKPIDTSSDVLLTDDFCPEDIEGVRALG